MATKNKRTKQKRELLTAAEETRVEEIHEEIEGIVEEITADPEMPEEDLEEKEEQLDVLLEELEEIAPTEAEADEDETPPAETRKAKRARLMKTARGALGSRSTMEAAQSRDVLGRGGVRREVPAVGRDSGEAQARGRALMQKRTVTVGSSNVVVPKHYASDIKGTFNDVSSIVDLVNVQMLPGGESYTQPFEKGVGMGGYTTEGSAAATAEPEVDYVEISKAKITAYAEDTEEVLKLPAADYDALVMASTRRSIRKLLAQEILVGTGANNRICGIFKAPAKVIPTDTDLTLSGVDENTLDEIIFSYGGDEDVEGMAVLLLNKADLKAFAQVRGTENKQRVYDIVNNGNTGTINGIPYVINSACPALAAPATAGGTYCMAYGNLSNYTLAVFSDVDVTRSTDTKFKEGIVAHRGVLFAGGNVAAWKGFIRVKKAAA